MTQDFWKAEMTKRFNIPLSHLDYGYIRECKDVKELEKIIRVLRSGDEGSYPEMEKEAVERLENLNPKSRMLRKEHQAVDLRDLDLTQRKTLVEELETWTSEMANNEQSFRPGAGLKMSTEAIGIEDDEGLPPVRSAKVIAADDKVKEDTGGEPEKMTKKKNTLPRSFQEWDKVNIDEELDKVDKVEPVKQIKTNPVPSTFKPESVSENVDTNGMSEGEKRNKAVREKDKGNEAFFAKDYEESIIYYSRSLSIQPLTATYNNRALAYLRLSKWDETIKDCKVVLKMEPKNVKALLRRGTALKGKEELKGAKKDLKAVLDFEPNNKTAQDLLKEISQLEEKAAKEGKEKGRRLIIEEVEGSEDEAQDEDVMEEIMVEKPEKKKAQRKKQTAPLVNGHAEQLEAAQTEASKDIWADEEVVKIAQFPAEESNTETTTTSPLASEGISERGSPRVTSSDTVKVDGAGDAATKSTRDSEKKEAIVPDEIDEQVATLSGLEREHVAESDEPDGNPVLSEANDEEEYREEDQHQHNFMSEDSEKQSVISDGAYKQVIISDGTNKQAIIYDDKEKRVIISDDEEKQVNIPDEKEKQVIISDEKEKQVLISDDTEKQVISSDKEKPDIISDDRDSPLVLAEETPKDTGSQDTDESVSESSESEKEEEEERGIGPAHTRPVYIQRSLSAVQTQLKEEGNSLFRTGQYPEAIEAYTRVIAMLQQAGEDQAVNCSLIYSNRAACYQKIGDCQMAIADCDTALSLLPHSAKTLLRRATAYESLERYRHAYVDFKHALSVDPTAEQAQQGATRCQKYLHSLDGHHWRDKLPPAVKMSYWDVPDVVDESAVRSSAPVLPLSPTHHTSASCVAQGGNSTPAATTAPEPPSSPPLCKLLTPEEQFEESKAEGNQLVQKGDYAGAVKSYCQCADLFPDRAAVYTNRALCYLRLNQVAEAEGDCTKALALEPSNPKAFYRRALARKALKQYKDSLQDLLQLLRLEPSNTAAKKEMDLVKGLYKKEYDQLRSHPPTTEKKPAAEPEKCRKRMRIEEVEEDSDSEGKESQSKTNAARSKAKVQSQKTASNSSSQETGGHRAPHATTSPNQPSSTPSSPSKTAATRSATEAKKPGRSKAKKGVAPEPGRGSPTAAISTAKMQGKITPFEFLQHWNSLKQAKDIQPYVQLIEQISPEELPHVISSKLDGHMLQIITRCASHDAQTGEVDRAYRILRNLRQVPRFSTVALFLSNKEKQDIKKVLESVRKSGSYNDEEVATVRKDYGLK